MRPGSGGEGREDVSIKIDGLVVDVIGVARGRRKAIVEGVIVGVEAIVDGLLKLYVAGMLY